MARIAQYGGPQVRTAVVGGPRARSVDVTGGADVIKGATDLAAGFARRAQRINTTESEEAIVKFERAKNDLFFNPENGYFNTQGKTAHEMSDSANESLQKLARSHADSLPNPQARQMFMNVANRHITSGQTDIMRHSTKGLEAWEISTTKAQTENAIENAALFRNDDKKLSVQRELGRQSIYEAARLEGITGDALNERLQTYEAVFASSTIDAAILDNSADGQTALDKYGDRLEGADKVKFENRIDAKVKSEQNQTDAQEAVRLATGIVGDADGNRSVVLEALNGIEDESVRSKTRKEAMYQVNQIETARVESSNDTFDAADKFIKDNGSVESYKAAYPDEWDDMSATQQRKLEKGVTADNDWNTWTDIESSSDEEIRKMNRSEVDKRAMKLDNSHRNQFIKRWGDLRRGETTKPEAQVGRTRATQTKSAVEQLMGKKSRKWSTKDQAKSDRFYGLVDQEHESRKDQLGRDLSSEEFTDMLNGLTRKVTVEKSFWPDPELGIGDIPEEHLDSLTNALRERNIPITSDNLIRVYEQAK